MSNERKSGFTVDDLIDLSTMLLSHNKTLMEIFFKHSQDLSMNEMKRVKDCFDGLNTIMEKHRLSDKEYEELLENGECCNCGSFEDIEQDIKDRIKSDVRKH